MRRGLKLYLCLVRYCLVREMMFRVNFLARVVAGGMWLALVLVFFEMIFLKTQSIGEWDKHQFLFFLGTGFLLNAVIDTFFLDNCTNLAELIRSGNLDFALLKPIDEQFLLSLEKIDWASAPNVLIGASLLVYSAHHCGAEITPFRILSFGLMLLAGVAILYSILLSLASSSVWLVRNQALYEIWFYVDQFARYPAEIYRGGAVGLSLRIALMFVIPVLLAINIPARYGVRLDRHDNFLVAYLFVAAAVLLVASRWFFRFALRAYRSASS